MKMQRILTNSNIVFKHLWDHSSIVPALSCQIRTKYTRTVRKPLKKFVPSTRHEFNTEDVIKENELKYGKVEDKVVSEIDENLKPDYLPDGLTMDKLPKFSRILGWDKTNPTIK